MEDMKKKVTDDNLEEVTGGGWENAFPRYKSGDTPRYKVGDIVGGEYRVASVSKKKSGLINKEFTYSLVYLNAPDKVYDDNAYESQLMGLDGLL